MVGLDELLGKRKVLPDENVNVSVDLGHSHILNVYFRIVKLFFWP